MGKTTCNGQYIFIKENLMLCYNIIEIIIYISSIPNLYNMHIQSFGSHTHGLKAKLPQTVSRLIRTGKGNKQVKSQLEAKVLQYACHGYIIISYEIIIMSYHIDMGSQSILQCMLIIIQIRSVNAQVRPRAFLKEISGPCLVIFGKFYRPPFSRVYLNSILCLY